VAFAVSNKIFLKALKLNLKYTYVCRSFKVFVFIILPEFLLRFVPKENCFFFPISSCRFLSLKNLTYPFCRPLIQQKRGDVDATRDARGVGGHFRRPCAQLGPLLRGQHLLQPSDSIDRRRRGHLRRRLRVRRRRQREHEQQRGRRRRRRRGFCGRLDDQRFVELQPGKNFSFTLKLYKLRKILQIRFFLLFLFLNAKLL